MARRLASPLPRPTREFIQSQGVTLSTVHWTFVDLGTRFGVLLTMMVNPTLGLEVSQHSPFYLFTKDRKPVYLQLLFP